MRPNLSALLCAAALACLAPSALAAERSSERGIDACALLLDDEVRSAVGRDIHRGERHDAGEFEWGDKPAKLSYSSTCLWRIGFGEEASPDPGSSLADTSFVMVNAIRWSAGSEGAKHYLQSFKEAAEDSVIDQAPNPLDIAEEALWWGDGVALRKGGTSVGVSVHLPGERQKERALEEYLAKIIASRL